MWIQIYTYMQTTIVGSTCESISRGKDICGKNDWWIFLRKIGTQLIPERWEGFDPGGEKGQEG